MLLATMTEIATNAINLKVNVVPNNIVKVKKDFETLSPYSEKLENNHLFAEYLLANIDELPRFKAFMENDMYLGSENDKFLSMLNELCKLGNRMYEKLSSFSIEDMNLAFNHGSDVCYSSRLDANTLYVLMYIARTKRQYNIDNMNKTFPSCFIGIIENGYYELYKHLDEITQDNVTTLYHLHHYRLNPDLPMKSLRRLEDTSYVTMIDYFTNFVDGKIEDENICDANYATIVHILNMIYHKKVKPVAKEKSQVVMSSIIKTIIADKLDHKRLRGFYNALTTDDIDTIANTLDGKNINIFDYINIATNERFENVINIAKNTNTALANLILYALENKKYAFLEVVEKSDVDYTDFNLGYSSLMLNPDTYEKYINLNEVNAKDYKKLLSLPKRTMIVNGITPKELIALVDSESGLQKLYLKLTGKIDDKLTILRQLKNVDYPFDELVKDINTCKLERLATKLSEKNLARRIEDTPYEIETETMLKLLSLEDKYQTIINEATCEMDCEFIIRAISNNTLDLTSSLVDNMNNFISTDVDCSKMFALLNLSDQFKTKNETTIKEFCIRGNASVVMAYYRGGTKKMQENILKIAKAEMAGMMDRFKFFDLNKEIEHELSDEELNMWKKNVVIDNDCLHVYETYSFEDTMLIGVKPDHTCMNYKDGMYRECLLANFDSNKKILFAKYNGKIVGRAIIRFTKSINENDNAISKTVNFIDVENANLAEGSSSIGHEKLTIFVERPYFAHVNDNVALKIKNAFLEVIKQKTKNMDVVRLACGNYGDCKAATYTSKKVFISHTKNGVQYMDSFGGMNELRNEASYNSVSCLTF